MGPDDQRKNSDQHEEDLIRSKIPGALAQLKIDITFDDSANQEEEDQFDFATATLQRDNSYGFSFEQNTHKGLASCRLIKNYVEHYKCLKEVSIILKCFLVKMDLNSPYHGKYFLFIHLTFLFSSFWWPFFLLYCFAPGGIHEQMEPKDERNADSSALAHGLP